MQTSSKKDLIYKLQHQNDCSVEFIYFFGKCLIDRDIQGKKATKMQNCGIRNGGMGHEFALKLLLVGIKVLNYPKIIK